MSKSNKHKREDVLFEIEQPEDEVLESAEDIVSPFDPKDIKIIVEPKTIDHLVSRLRFDEIDLNTEFQRKGNLWSHDKQCRLIESIMLRLPLPAFYFDATNDNKWLVVDGLQRLWSLKNFIVNAELNDENNKPITLTGLEILTDYNNKEITYNLLNRTMQRRILETPITTYLIQPGTPKKVKYNVFKRINSGGLGLNAMEIRNALNQEQTDHKTSPAQFLKDLSEDDRLKAVLRVQDKRMEDRELLLRAYSFIDKDFSEYEKPLSTYLDKAMETLSGKTNIELNKISSGIVSAVHFQKDIFGKHIFSRSILGGKTRVTLNSALFEVWVSEIYKLNDSQKARLISKKSDLIREYKKLLTKEEFVNAVVSSTSSKGAVKIRFGTIQTLIKKFI
ncbi:MAG: DUF262 domain-containing protein [Bacteroidota bacterium]|nr:DUF262 domain-containing protein [Bacteroidota bacterium]